MKYTRAKGWRLGSWDLALGTDCDRHNKLDQYLGLTVENVKDPLKWWFEKCMAYPNLSHMALDY